MKTFNPYVGPLAFEEQDSPYFFGRETETRQLASLVIAHKAILLYAPSGAGKTSLLKAGLTPRLKGGGKIAVLPIGRVGGDLPPDVNVREIKNIYVFNTLLNLLGKDVAPESVIDRPLNEGLASVYFKLTKSSLSGLEADRLPETVLESLKSLQEQKFYTENAFWAAIQDKIGEEQTAAYKKLILKHILASQPCLLILDQFEELFTTHPECYPEREDFFFQLQRSLKDHPRLTLLLSMREDYIAQLDSYAAQLPDRLRTHFRLELLGEEAAFKAVWDPAHKAGVDFEDEAAKQLIDDLRKIHVQKPDGKTTEELGRHVEPVQLQVVCRRLWEKLPADAVRIGKADLEAVGDVDSALADYYDDRVKAAVQETGIRERAIREWFERQLITKQGLRGLVPRGSRQSGGLKNQAIEFLVDIHLIRSEERLNATWYELAHDRLIEPVRKNNAKWFQENLSTLQRQADLWENQGRPKGLLLHDEALVEVERWAADYQDDLTSIEHDFLAACWEARAITERERKQARRIRWLAIVSTIISVIAIIASLVAYYQRAETEKAKIKAAVEQGRNKQLTLNAFELQLARASILARIDKYTEARKIMEESRKWDESISAKRRHARDLMTWFTDLMGRSPSENYTGANSVLFDTAISPDGRLVAVVGEKGTVALFDMNSNRLFKHLKGYKDDVHVKTVAFHPQKPWLVTAGKDRIIVWSLSTWEQIGDEWKAYGGAQAMAISPDGKYLASGGTYHDVTLWDPVTRKELGVLKEHSGAIRDLAFSPDGRLLASTSEDNTARIWDLETRKTLHILKGHTKPLNNVVFHPDGHLLATSSDDHTIRLWQTDSGEVLRALTGHTNEVNGLVFVKSGERLVSGSRDHTLRVWDTETGIILRVLQGHESLINGLTAHAGRVFSVSGDQTLRRWDIVQEEAQGKMRIVDLPVEPFSSAIAPDGSSVAVGFHDGTLRLYSLPDGYPLDEYSKRTPNTIYSVNFSPDSKYLAATLSRDIMLWQVNKGALSLIGRLESPAGKCEIVTRVAFAPNNKILASACSDGLVGLFDMQQQDKGKFFNAHKGFTNSVNFDANGRYLLSTGEDGKTRLWDLKSWPPTQKGALEDNDVMMWAAFSSDNRYIARVGRGLLLHIFNVQDKTQETFEGHTNLILRAAFSPNSEQVATLSTDATIRFWDLTLKTELFTLRFPANTGLEVPVWDFDFSCTKTSPAAKSECWLAVPLVRGKLILYNLGQIYD